MWIRAWYLRGLCSCVVVVVDVVTVVTLVFLVIVVALISFTFISIISPSNYPELINALLDSK